MNTMMLNQVLKTKNNGQWFTISWCIDLPLTAAAKKEGNTAYKMSTCQCRKGITYANQKSVQAKVDAGKVLTHELPWGEWKKGYEGLFITHKGKDYLRVYLGPNKPKTEYFVNGVKYTYQELKDSGLVQASFFNKKSEKPDALTVKTENIHSIICKKNR